jgi:hypothetical protein
MPYHNLTPRQRQQVMALLAAVMVHIIAAAAMIIVGPFDKIPYHTSALTGQMWVNELLAGHPDRIKNELGMRKHVFQGFVLALRLSGLEHKRDITVEEQAAIFLYMSVTGLSIVHVGERFQRANDTISKYVILQNTCFIDQLCCRYYKLVLVTVTSFPFYNTYVHLPPVDAPIPPEIENNPKLFPYFQHVLGAIDGTHVACCPSELERQHARDRKGNLSHNVLAVCSFDMVFYYIGPGWDGCTADSRMFTDSRLAHFAIPQGRCYLADAGFGICDELLIPYRGERYHLAEWGRANIR